MIVIVACAKRQRIQPHPDGFELTTPHFQNHAHECMAKLAKYSSSELARILKVSPELAKLNAERFNAAQTNIPSLAALHTFDGDVFQAMEREAWSMEDWQHASGHLRIISGLYGVLRPFDRIVPHRLEMSTRVPWLKTSLANHWKASSSAFLMEDPNANSIINLASQDYASAVDHTPWKARWINIHFWDLKKNGQYAVIGVHSKRARGQMCQAIVKNKWIEPEALQSFSNGYQYAPEHSDAQNWIYTRNPQVT